MRATKSLYGLFLNGLFCLIFLFATSSSVCGQANKKRMLTPEYYHLWSMLIPDNVSNEGNWVSYRLHYESTKIDTMVVRQTKHHKQHIFPFATEGKFNGESAFACVARDTLVVQQLNTGVRYKVPDNYSFAFSANQKFVLIFLKQVNDKLNFEIRDQTGKVVKKVADITNYCFDPGGNGVLYSTAKDGVHGVEMLLYKDAIVKRTIVENHKSPFLNLIWKENAVAFIENIVSCPLLFNYNIVLNKLSTLDPIHVKGFPSNMKISDAQYSRAIHTGSQIIFWLKEPLHGSDVIDSKAVQIWNTRDKQLFASKKYFGDYRFSDKMAIWDLKENTVIQITDKNLPSGFLSADYNYAFTYDKYAYEPQSQQHGAYDLHLVNLKNGERKRIIERYVFGDHIPSRSPDGRYLCYAKKGHWWIYDIQQDLHTVITVEMRNSFFVEDRNSPGEDEPYGIGGWTKDGEVILYDRYDLWKISLDGKVKTRLTNGREMQKVFRIKFFSNPFEVDIEANRPNLDLNKGFSLTVANKESGETGLSYWSSKSGLKELVWENKRIEQVIKANKNDTYMYVDENFVSAPRLMVYDGKPKEIMQSNTQQEHFYWSKNERIEYTVDGKKMKGILFYPAAYNAALKYPMVVHIYERQFAYLNVYENPSSHDPLGFNVNNFTTQGYFVLYPDINYEYGNLRESVPNSVLAAVDTALRKGNIDPKKVGLIGSSFGGYETDLVVTQTDRFATAVAGLAWTDVVSGYLYVGDMFKRPDFFRAENHQIRIGKSLFEDMPAYLKNSPVLLADKVKTPLLGWVGEDDKHVNSLHSMEFYLALRRADKEHTLLVYPGEGHGIENREKAVDLNIRIMQWFDYYLKKGEKQDWMNSK
jgi:dipeptidyl aminopeptidase/acylaminoacyl peptidase